jgi:hypothetical protein
MASLSKSLVEFLAVPFRISEHIKNRPGLNPSVWSVHPVAYFFD